MRTPSGCSHHPECTFNCCGHAVISPLYFITFVILAQFILLNVVVVSSTGSGFLHDETVFKHFPISPQAVLMKNLTEALGLGRDDSMGEEEEDDDELLAQSDDDDCGGSSAELSLRGGLEAPLPAQPGRISNSRTSIEQAPSLSGQRSRASASALRLSASSSLASARSRGHLPETSGRTNFNAIGGGGPEHMSLRISTQVVRALGRFRMLQREQASIAGAASKGLDWHGSLAAAASAVGPDMAQTDTRQTDAMQSVSSSSSQPHRERVEAVQLQARAWARLATHVRGGRLAETGLSAGPRSPFDRSGSTC